VSAARYEACTVAVAVVMGRSHRNSDSSDCSEEPAKRSSSAAGRSAVAIGGMNHPAPARQKLPAANAQHHHVRQRATVCRLTPTNSCNRRIRTGVTPQRIAEINTTIVAK
jgi:hypothetical protein